MGRILYGWLETSSSEGQEQAKGALVATSKAMADTGCSTMVAGIDFIRYIGLTESDLVPTMSTVRAANKAKIEILGELIVDIRLITPSADKATKQVVLLQK